MNQHGFARRAEFALAASTADACAATSLLRRRRRRRSYPFDFLLAVEHSVSKAGR
jgi:galactose mutarotase-like enzyme